MPVVPNFLERLLLMRLNLAPAALLDVFSAGALRAATAALDLGVFDALTRGPRTTADLASALQAEPRALGALLELLARSGYLRHEGNAWANTAMTAKWLVGPRTQADVVRNWSGILNELFADLPDTIRRGTTRKHLHEWLAERPERWRTFNAAMVEIASIGAEEIAQRAPLPANAKSLIDIGGNHAINAIAFCTRYPDLRATVFDLPAAFGDARVRARERGVADRVSFVAGDFMHDPLGNPFDAALLLNVLHYQTEAPNIALLRKTRDALAPNGIVVILEQLADAAPSPSVRTFIALFDLLCATAMGGGVATYDAIAGWLREAGFTNVRRIGLRSTPASALIVATRS